MYEAMEAGRRLLPLLPICARLDGRGFSKFTQHLQRPYDVRLTNLMVETTKYLIDETHAKIGYTQSDEISLVWLQDEQQLPNKSQNFFDGRIQKLTSVLAAMATAYFNAHLSTYIPEKAGALPVFDCRVWSVPTKEEAANTFLWRELDATKNSISMAARTMFSHSALHGVSGRNMQAMMLERGTNWNDYPSFFKRGTFVRRKTIQRAFTADELEKLPEKHEARKNPQLLVERSIVEKIDMPPFTRVLNRVEVIFAGAEPITATEPASPSTQA